jgi:hypothetical protein
MSSEKTKKTDVETHDVLEQLVMDRAAGRETSARLQFTSIQFSPGTSDEIRTAMADALQVPAAGVYDERASAE